MHPKFKYIHLANDGVTIGYQINDDDNTVTYAISRTSVRDRFNKALGRKIVEGRITKGGVKANGVNRSYTLPLATVGSTRYKDISKYLIDLVHGQ